MLKSVDRSDNNLNSVGIWGRQANLPTRCPCNSGCCIYSIIAKYILSINPGSFIIFVFVLIWGEGEEIQSGSRLIEL